MWAFAGTIPFLANRWGAEFVLQLSRACLCVYACVRVRVCGCVCVCGGIVLHKVWLMQNTCFGSLPLLDFVNTFDQVQKTPVPPTTFSAKHWKYSIPPRWYVWPWGERRRDVLLRPSFFIILLRQVPFVVCVVLCTPCQNILTIVLFRCLWLNRRRSERDRESDGQRVSIFSDARHYWVDLGCAILSGQWCGEWAQCSVEYRWVG